MAQLAPPHPQYDEGYIFQNSDIIVRTQALSTNFCVAWLNLPPPPPPKQLGLIHGNGGCLSGGKSTRQFLCGSVLVLILDRNLAISVLVRSNLCNSICLRHLIKPKAVTIEFFLLLSARPFFLRAGHVQSYHAVHVPWVLSSRTTAVQCNRAASTANTSHPPPNRPLNLSVISFTIKLNKTSLHVEKPQIFTNQKSASAIDFSFNRGASCIMVYISYVLYIFICLFVLMQM